MERLIPEKKKRVLIVEDDVSLNRLIAYNLCQNGYAVESVYDGVAAHKQFLENSFDLVILDIMLPGVDGFRLCEFIRNHPAGANIAVVILTARAEPLDKIYGNVVGADYYLTKPFSVRKLMAVIDEMAYRRGDCALSLGCRVNN